MQYMPEHLRTWLMDADAEHLEGARAVARRIT